MQEFIQQGNKVYIVSCLVTKMHSSCDELADTPGTRLFIGDQDFFTPKLLFRLSYLWKSDFFSAECFSSAIYIDFPESGTLIY